MHKIYPFKFLDSYGKDDTKLFFGRDEEINAMYEMIFQGKMLLVYGASGTGKTSLIQCGLAGRFQAHDWLSLFIRRGNNLNASFEKVLADAGGNITADDDIDLSGLMDDEHDTQTAVKQQSQLARSFKAVYLNSFRPIYLIFDQFEELFILGSKQEQEQFIGTVQEILKMDQPIKMIFSIREEYLGHLYEFEKEVPQLMRKKLRVEPMNMDKVREVITGISTLKGSCISLLHGEEEAITQAIFDKIKDSNKTLTIQLPYLQVFLDKLYDATTHDDTHQADAVFTMNTINKMGDIGDILRDFLEEQVKSISVKLTTGRTRPVSTDDIWKILSPFATLEGTKEPISMESLIDKVPDIDSGLIKSAVTAFVNSRIVRQSEDGHMYELAHDTLAGKIAAKRTDEEIALLEVKRLIKSQVSVKENARELFTERQLNFIEPYLTKLPLSAEETSLIDKSRSNVKRQRKTRIARFAVIISGIISVLVSIYAFQQKDKANEETRKAIIASQYANKQQQEALQQKRMADNARQEALKAKAIAIAAKDTAELLKQKAMEQERMALMQKQIADKQRMLATQSEQIARQNAALSEKNAELATASEKEAEKSKVQALYEKAEAQRLTKLAESKNNAHKAILHLNAGEIQEATRLALRAYNDNLDSKGPVQNNDIYSALLWCWEHAITNKQSATLNSAIRCIAISPTGDIISGTEAGGITVCTSSQGILSIKASAHGFNNIRSLVISPGGAYVLVVMQEQTVLLDNKLKLIAKVHVTGTGKCGAFLNESTYVVLTSKGITKFDVNEKVQRGDLQKSEQCTAIVIGRHERIFIATGSTISEYKGLDDFPDKPINTFKLQTPVSCMSIDKSGKYIAAGTYNGTLWLKQLGSSGNAVTCRPHLSAVHDIKFGEPSGGLLQLASASGDNTIKLTEITDNHTLNTDDMITLADHTNWVYSLVYSADGKYIFSGGEDRTLRAWPTSMNQLYNNLTRK